MSYDILFRKQILNGLDSRFYRKKQLKAIIADTGHRLLFLPSYSPDLNPIEKYRANLKRKMKEIVRYFANFYEAFSSLF